MRHHWFLLQQHVIADLPGDAMVVAPPFFRLLYSCRRFISWFLLLPLFSCSRVRLCIAAPRRTMLRATTAAARCRRAFPHMTSLYLLTFRSACVVPFLTLFAAAYHFACTPPPHLLLRFHILFLLYPVQTTKQNHFTFTLTAWFVYPFITFLHFVVPPLHVVPFTNAPALYALSLLFTITHTTRTRT